MLARQYIDATPAADTRETLPASDGRYALDNAAVQAGERMTALSEIFDAGTMHHIEQRGITSGWHCLEIGGGGGSIANWMSERVGRTGRVLVTDINTRFLDSLQRPNLEVRRHNIVTDPLPEGAFDLIHARLVLMHLPERDDVLARLIKALKPGGWLIDEEFDVLSMPTDAGINPRETSLHSISALNRVLEDRGVELRSGRFLYGRLRALGLAEVGAQGRLSAGGGGSVVAKLVRSNLCQLREVMIERGYTTAEELEDDLRNLDHPDSLGLTPVMWSAWGRRPGAADRIADATHFIRSGI
jgi:SAM-dependent methyltransferase